MFKPKTFIEQVIYTTAACPTKKAGFKACKSQNLVL